MPPEELGYDELSAVLMVATGNSIADKFRLSHVCRSWRNVALSTPCLWSCFAVRTMADALRLPAVIQRASPRMSVPMDITLDFARRKVVRVGGRQTVVPLINLGDRLGIYQDLGPHMPFVKRLCIELGVIQSDLTASEPLSRLFSFATPALMKLSVSFSDVSAQPTAEQQPIITLEAAPRLRSLALTGAIPQDWKTAISPALEKLFLRVSGVEDRFLVEILRTCPRLTHFTFLPQCPADFAFATLPIATKLERLRVLHIGGPVRSIWSTIAPMLCPAVLDSVTVTVDEDAPPGTTAFFGQNIFPDAWSPVSCSVLGLGGQKDLRVVDGAGKERRVLTAEPRSRFRDVWDGLVLKTNARDTITSFSFSDWAEVCEAFHTNPLRHPGVQLRFPLPGAGTLDYPNTGDLAILNCPTVRGVTFEMDDDSWRLILESVLNVVDHIVHQYATVCVYDAFPEQLDRVWVSEWLVMLQTALSQRNGWLLCSHCAAHII